MNEHPQGLLLSKYEMTRDALAQTFTDMQDGSGVGLIFFPNTPTASPNGPCIVREQAVPSAALDAALRESLIRVLAAKLPSGATPTHDAFRYAIETLRASPLAGDKYVILVTDGAPTYALECIGDGMTPADSAPLIAETASARLTFGIRTFVIGSPGSEAARSALSQMATQGGTALAVCSDQGPNYCHFDMTSAADLSVALSAALQNITGSTRSCSYAIPMPVNGAAIDLSRVNVVVKNSAGGSTTIPKASSTPCTGGWQFGADATTIVLCPDACGAVQADAGAEVDLLVGCQTLTQ